MRHGGRPHAHRHAQVAHGQVSCGESAGPVTLELRQRLVDIQYGRAADTHGWMQRLV